MPRPRFNCYTSILIVVCGALFVVHFSPLKYHECDNVNLNANQLKKLYELQSTTTSSVVSAAQNTILSELLEQSYTKGYGACPKVSPMLRGSVGIRLKEEGEANWPPTFKEIAQQNQRLQNGGFYPGPEDCEARSSIAIIIPYRDREDHLRYLLHYLHGILQRQQSKYIVVVVEQDDQNTFNKGLLMNIGFRYVTNSTNFRPNCVFFHDVDSLSEDDRTLYNCTGGSKVVHLSSRMDKFDYRWCCGVTVGGVLGMTPEQYIKINGYSNRFCGWGGEDDEMNRRIKEGGGFQIFRPGEGYSKFRMISHARDLRNPDNKQRFQLVNTWKARQYQDGLNSLPQNISTVEKQITHTHLYVRPHDCATS